VSAPGGGRAGRPRPEVPGSLGEHREKQRAPVGRPLEGPHGSLRKAAERSRGAAGDREPHHRFGPVFGSNVVKRGPARRPRLRLTGVLEVHHRHGAAAVTLDNGVRHPVGRSTAGQRGTRVSQIPLCCEQWPGPDGRRTLGGRLGVIRRPCGTDKSHLVARVDASILPNGRIKPTFRYKTTWDLALAPRSSSRSAADAAKANWTTDSTLA